MAAPGFLRAPRWSDIAISMVCAAIAAAVLVLLGQLTTSLPEEGIDVPGAGTSAWWLILLVTLMQCVLLAWARYAPRIVVLAVSVVVLAFALTLPGAVFDLAALAIPIAVFLAFRTSSSRQLWWALAAAVVIVGAANYLNSVGAEGSEPLAALGEAVVQIGGLFGIPLLLASMLRARRDSREAQRRELRALTRERDALVDAAVARERTAMARELHDIAAHHLSGIALMASAMQRQVHTDPDAAQAAAVQIRMESTAVLQNLRSVVGMLRVDGVAERTVETFASVPELVSEIEQARDVQVRLLVKRADDGRPLASGVGPLSQLAAYRTIQESLANAAMHSPGAACVVEIDDTQPGAVTVRVRNEPASATPSSTSAGGGYGLVGMRERADLVGADLRYGRTGDGGWDVLLIVPREVAVDENTGGRSL